MKTVIIVYYPEHDKLTYFVKERISSIGGNQHQEITVTFNKEEATTYSDHGLSLKECSKLQKNAEGRRVEVEFSSCYKEYASLT